MSERVDARRRTLLRSISAAGLLAGLGAAPPVWPADRKHVVIAGGGFAGASCALALKRFMPALAVTLIDRQAQFVTGPFCNTVISGLNPMSAITQDHGGLVAAGVKVMHAPIDGVDAEARRVHLGDGRRIGADRLIVAPGIGFRWDEISGYGPQSVDRVPHAWPGGSEQLRTLRGQLRRMPEDGRVIITVPDYPYRCPPGPYERASLIAYFLKQHKPKASVLLLDAKDHFIKESLFRVGWGARYGDRIEWRGRRDGARAVAVDVDAKRVHTAGGEAFDADVLNVVPPQRAGQLAVDAGLTDASGWVPVAAHDFSIPGYPGVHALGDSARADPMPKSAYAANMQAHVCALAITRELAGKKAADNTLINACYSLVAPDYGISIVDMYALHGDRIAAIPGAGGESPPAVGPDYRAAEADNARAWYRNIVRDSFG